MTAAWLLIGVIGAALVAPGPWAPRPPAEAAGAAPVEQHLAFLPVVGKSELEFYLVGAGDIADCNAPTDEATAALIENMPGTVATFGDNADETGSDAEFNNCYSPSWGRFKNRTRPSLGNHDYGVAGAAAYFRYFGAAAGEPGKGYYSYDLGAWHIVAINSNCGEVGGCQAGSAQEQWLRRDLAAHPALCSLAYWHHPRFSSGPHGSTAEMSAIWQALYQYGAEIVLNGHDHLYERFSPQGPNGELDQGRGIREFVVGTGGRSLAAFGPYRLANSEVSRDGVFGVMRLVLRPASYKWEFHAVPGAAFQDSGAQHCH